MVREPESLRVYRFKPDGLDPVTVFVEQFGPTASRITVQCYAQAWTAFWGSHGEQTVEEFVCSCNAEYVTSNLKWGQNGLMLKTRQKDQWKYLLRIVEAIKIEFSKKDAQS